MKTAVILTARKEKDSQIPFPLIPFDERKCLIDRSIEILRELNYNKIIIVIGYRAELFDKYKTKDVVLVENKDYEFTSSMGSLALARDYIQEDFLLLEGDTFYEKYIIEQLTRTEHPTCLAMTDETGSGDECYVETKLGFVTKITKDRHRVCNIEGELIGILKLSLNIFDRILIAYNECTNPHINYEYLLMDVTSVLERPVIKFKNLIWGDVDTQEDFKRLKNITYRKLCRKENPFDKENLLQYLADIFPGQDISTAQIVQIGGMSNKNFKITFQNQEYILRVPGNGSEGMVDRSNEEFNAMVGCKLGVNPYIKYFNPITGIKLADYITNAETLNSATIQRHDNMAKIAEIYRNIHNSHIRLKNEFNIFREIEKYDLLIEKVNATMYEGWEIVRPQIMALENYLNELGVDLRPCHNDAVPENFIKSGNKRIYLIDWEYSGINDPMADFASLFLESKFSEENQDYMMKQYFQSETPANTWKKILCYQILWDYLWAQWTVIKEANGDDFGAYGKDRFDRAKINLLKIKDKELWR